MIWKPHIWIPKRELLLPKRSFLPGMFPGGVAGGGEPAITVASVSFLDTDGSSSTLTTYSFSNVTLGDAHSSREIFLAVQAFSQTEGSPRTVSSGSIGGASLRSPHVNQVNVGSHQSISLVSAPVPSGTTGTVSVTMSGTCLSLDIAVFRVVGMNSATPHDTLQGTDANPSTGTIDVPEDGFVIAAGTGISASGTACTWTGVTETFDKADARSEDRFTGGFVHQLGVQSGRTITVENGSTNMIMCAASFA